ncbi:MAG: TIGR02584 family CRISPR-associated protein [Chthoniobacterales bacterium]|nr:TIGR02584 family CRISPR-associated protein [Chthoniobacterales bacterium]
MKTTLVAVSGMSPAILTETLWALANEHLATVPDEVIVITTSRGEADIRRDLLAKNKAWAGRTVWETLRADIFALTGQAKKSRRLQLAIRVIDLPDETTGLRTPAADLRTREHNDEAANFIIQTLAPFCDATDQHVIASIAGGRKTMGALLYAGMSLLGKESDRVTHVLVSDPFDTVRGFFYPAQPVQELEARVFGKDPLPVTARNAVVEMANIPFVPLRNKFIELDEPRRTFAGIVESYSRAERPLHAPPAVLLDIPTSTFTVLGKTMTLSGRELLIAAFLIERARKGKPPYENASQAEQDYQDFVTRFKKKSPFHRAIMRLQQASSAEDITKGLSDLRKKLTASGAGVAIPYLAPERSRIGFAIAAS